jgi:arylsulfatase A-like enzyme
VARNADKRYHRRSFLRLLGGVAASSAAVRSDTVRRSFEYALTGTLRTAGKRAKPNIVLIVGDDWAHNDLGIAGHPLLKTPNLDRLATEGVRFAKAFTPNPICTPSRAALLTGQDCWTNGCYFFGMPIKPESAHFAQLLAQAGYETFYTGKWHNDGLPSHRGFTAGKYIGGGGPGAGGHFKPRVSDFGGGNARQIERFDSELFTDAAVEFLDARPPYVGRAREADDKPFLLFVSFMTPHDPWTPPGKYATMYDPQAIELPPNFMPRPMNGSKPFDYYTDWHGNNLRDEIQMTPFPRTPEGLRDVRHRYYGQITHDDGQIGRILQALDRKGLTDDTLVIFLADHGISLGAHGILGKQTMYEEGIRLPLIVRYPRLQRGGAVNLSLVSLIDVFPTICQAAGVTIPSSVEGRSLLGLYGGQESWDRERIFASFVSPTAHRLNVRCIRTERYKLVHHLTTDEIELYDLEKDPYERDNLAGHGQFEGLQKQLTAQLLAWRKHAEGIRQSKMWNSIRATRAFSWIRSRVSR